MGIASCFERLESLQEAADSYNVAVGAYGNICDHFGLANAFKACGLVGKARGENQISVKELERARSLFTTCLKEATQPVQRVVDQDNFELIHCNSGDIHEYLHGKGSALKHLAILYLEMSNETAALECAEESHAIHENVN